MLLVEEEAGDGRGGGDEGRADDLEALVVVLLWVFYFFIFVFFFFAFRRREFFVVSKKSELFFFSSLLNGGALSASSHLERSAGVLGGLLHVLPCLGRGRLGVGGGGARLLRDGVLGGARRGLGVAGGGDPAGTEGASAEADDDAEAPALGVVAAERSAGVEARDERGVNDFLRDSPSFFERVRFSSVRAAAAESAIFFFCFWRESGYGEVVAEGR